MTPNPAAPHERASLKSLSTGQWVSRGYAVLAALVGGLFLFCIVFSISGAVVTGGTVTVEGNYKTVQHLDGGIVQKIAVRNGDAVKKGDLLLRLDGTLVGANLAIVEGRIRNNLIQNARLMAERHRKDVFTMPDAVRPFMHVHEVRDAFAAEMAVFKARRDSRLGQLSVLRKRHEQLDAQRQGLVHMLAARQREIKFALKERNAVRPLFRKGFASQQRYSAVERTYAQLEGDLGRLEGEMARTEGALAETRLSMAQAEKEFTQSVVDELGKARAQLLELEEQRKAHADKLARIEIRAPYAGRVHALQVHTEGGVIQAASPILQIIPEDGKFVVEAHVDPKDIDKVRSGLTARLRFPSFAAHSTPTLAGRVAKVSAAELTAKNGSSYFTAEIEVKGSELDRIGGMSRLVPGMPAEVFIETGARSIMSYLVKPLGDAMMRAFRES
ncbi:MAG: hypothetical protein RLZ98_2555 [Pseudomonadota bacterium]|jgi:HlyD family secretion protein